MTTQGGSLAQEAGAASLPPSATGSPSCQCPCGCAARPLVQTFVPHGSYLMCKACSTDHFDIIDAMPECSQCEQYRTYTPARVCPTHSNEFGILLPQDLTRLDAAQLEVYIATLRQQREESGYARRHAPRSTRQPVEPIDLASLTTAVEAVMALAQGRIKMDALLALVAEGRFTLEEVQAALG